MPLDHEAPLRALANEERWAHCPRSAAPPVTDPEGLPRHARPFKAGLPARVLPLDPQIFPHSLRWTVPVFAVCPLALQSQLLTDGPVTLAAAVWTGFGRKQICPGRYSGHEHRTGKPEVGSRPGSGTTWWWDLGQVATLIPPSSLWPGGVKPHGLSASFRRRCPVTEKCYIL